MQLKPILDLQTCSLRVKLIQSAVTHSTFKEGVPMEDLKTQKQKLAH